MAPSNSSSLLNSKSLEQVREELSSRDIPLVVAESFLLASISLISILGNALVLTAICRSPRLKSSPTNYLIISLASSDLLTALVVVPMSTGVLATGNMFMGVEGCKAFGCMTYLLSNITFYTVGLLAFNRFLRAWSLRWYDFFFSAKSTIMTIISSWIFQFIYAVLPAVANWSEVFLMPGYTTCALFVTNPAAKVIYRAQSELQMIGGFIIIIVCYIVVLVKIKKTQVIFPDPEQSSTAEHSKGPQVDQDDQGSRTCRYLTPGVPDSPVPGVTKHRMTTGVCVAEQGREEITSENENNEQGEEQIQENNSVNPDTGTSGDYVRVGGMSVSQERENETERWTPNAFGSDSENAVPSDFKQEATNAREHQREGCSFDAFGSDFYDVTASYTNQVATEAAELETQGLPPDMVESSIAVPQNRHRFLSSDANGSNSRTTSYTNKVATETAELKIQGLPPDVAESSKGVSQYPHRSPSYDANGSNPGVDGSHTNQAVTKAPQLETQGCPPDVAESSKSVPQHPHRRFLSQMKTTKLLFAITLFFLVSWIPLAVTIVVESYQSEYMSRQVELFGITLLYLGTTFNPVILPIMCRHFRKEFVKMLCIRNTVVVRPRISLKTNFKRNKQTNNNIN